MVSLSELSKVTEEGVHFYYPYDEKEEILLTPEESIRVQVRKAKNERSLESNRRGRNNAAGRRGVLSS